MKKDFLIILAATIVIIITFIFFSFRSDDTKNSEEPISSCETQDFTGEILPSERQAYFEGGVVDIPKFAYDPSEFETTDFPVLGVSNEEKWIEVDLSEQKIKAWEGNQLFLESLVSTGLSFSPTPIGEYRIWIKLRSTKMSGGTGRNYYYLPNVPYVMYFYKGYGLHGTYWHNDFGRPKSHGCVNLPTPIAERLYYWVTPVLSEGKNVVKASAENPGTRIVIHD